MICYHTTKQENVQNILKNGLTPNHYGSNKKFINDERTGIFLCNRQSVPYWMIILNHDALLQINLPANTQIDRFNYTLYSEIIYKNNIPPEAIKQRTTPFQSELCVANKILCESIITLLSYMTSTCANFYNRPDSDKEHFKQYIKNRTITIRTTGEAVKFQQISDQTLSDMLRELGEDGQYTFCDTYKNTPIRLWEQLMEYPKDDTYEDRQYIYDFIIKNFKNVLFTNTGGFTC